MKRDQMKRTLYASVIAGFRAAIPVVLRANAPGTMCSLAQSGQIDCIRSDHFAYDLCQLIENVSHNNGIDPGFSRVCCGKKADLFQAH